MVHTKSVVAEISKENDVVISTGSLQTENKETTKKPQDQIGPTQAKHVVSTIPPENQSRTQLNPNFTPQPSIDDIRPNLSPEKDVKLEKDANATSKSNATCSPTNSDTPALPPPPDGGWGWAVVLGCGLFHFFFVGLSHAAGVFYIGLRSAFPNASNAELASIMPTMVSLNFFLSPLASLLLRRGFSERQAIFVGGVFAGVGYVISAFSNSITGIRISIGLLVGLAGAFSALPSLALLGQYFERRRALATGLALLGSGLGGFAFPPLVALALEEYGLQGTLLLYAAMLLHLCLAAMLHRPLRRPQRPVDSPPATSERDTFPPRCLDFLLHLPVQLLHLPLHLLRSPFLRPPILLFLLAQILEYPSIWIPINFLPTWAQSHGVDKITASTLSSINNGGSAAGRLLVALTMDLPWLRRRRVAATAAAMFLGSAADVGVIYASSYAEFAAFAIGRGILDGITITFRLLVLQDLTGREGYTDALGFLAVFMGIGMVSIPPLAGVLVDAFGGVDAAFALAASTHFVAGAFVAIVGWQKWKSSREESGSGI